MTDFRQFVPRHRFQPTLAFSPDGARIAYSSNESGQFDLWVTGLDGSARRLTGFADRAVRDIAWSPDGTRIAFTADRQGNEQHQVFLVAPGDGGDGAGDPEPVRLTDVDDRQHYLADGPWTPDGATLVYTGNDRDERCHDVLVHDLASGDVRRVEVPPGMWRASTLSPDGTRLLVLELRGNTDGDAHVLNLTAPEAGLRRVTVNDGPTTHWGGPWTADSTAFHDRTDGGGEFTRVRLVDTTNATNGTGGAATDVLAPEWDVEAFLTSRDGRTMVWAVNEGGVSRLHARRDGEPLTMPAMPDGVVQAITLSADGDRVALVLATPVRPSELAVVDLAAGEFRYLTDSRPPALTTGGNGAGGVEPELVSYPTHDGRDVPAWLYRPRGDGPFPFLLSVHGGPEAQERPIYAYAGLYQFLLANGVGVLAPNIRGSNGYGRAYQELIHRDWGGDELRDLEHAALYLRGRDDVDADRLAVFGGSFGGFAALSCVSRLPRYWAAGVSVVGPSNLVTVARSVPPSWRPMMAAWIGDPDTEADFLTSRSPVTYAGDIVAPLMIVQGANDPRVVKAESDQIVEALRARGVEVRYDVYEDEGHGFTKRENEITALGDIGAFLLGHLTPAGARTTPPRTASAAPSRP
ncbi:MAG TPA: S9 family peptidase [Pseudonocardiaceae bacterium]